MRQLNWNWYFSRFPDGRPCGLIIENALQPFVKRRNEAIGLQIYTLTRAYRDPAISLTRSPKCNLNPRATTSHTAIVTHRLWFCAAIYTPSAITSWHRASWMGFGTFAPRFSALEIIFVIERKCNKMLVVWLAQSRCSSLPSVAYKTVLHYFDLDNLNNGEHCIEMFY